jgi:hypothetical protein
MNTTKSKMLFRRACVAVIQSSTCPEQGGVDDYCRAVAQVGLGLHSECAIIAQAIDLFNNLRDWHGGEASRTRNALKRIAGINP